MSDWRRHADTAEWRLIEWEILDDKSQIELLDRLRQAVPCRMHTNLMEQFKRHDTIDEALATSRKEVLALDMSSAEAKRHIENAGAAAAMLMNLEARHGEEINWLDQAETFAAKVLMEEDVTGRKIDNASPEFSRHAHAGKMIELLQEFRESRTLALSQVDGAEQAWLAEVIDQAAATGYWAGRRLQAAWGKPLEVMAVTGEGVLKGVKSGGEARKGKLGPDTDAILDTMEELIDSGHFVSNAARIVKRKYGLGTSANANRQLYKRHRGPRNPS